ncbi:hypothetical protein ID866_7458 [Astraeus odoratus]|nr:hypothetical protein ID866_7458 [Astraeus odoratus]
MRSDCMTLLNRRKQWRLPSELQDASHFNQVTLPTEPDLLLLLQTSHILNALPSLQRSTSCYKENSGCFKCCHLFQNHTTSICLNDFPNPKGYKTLTAEDVEASKSKKCPPPVTALAAEEPVTKQAHAEEIVEPAAVVMPSATLGNGSDSGEECISPLTVPHFYWTCLLDGPNLKTSLSIEALIDHGSHLVLIDDALVKTLGLKRHQLPKPLEVSVAHSLNQTASCCETMPLSEYVELSCLSVDSVFHSCTVHAVIAPGLCTPLLLGGPFLSHNHFIIDHELHTCINKDTGYDLLNPPLLPAVQPKPVTPTIQEVVQACNRVMDELHWKLCKYKEVVDASCTPVTGVNVIALVQQWIETLALQEELQK